MDQFTREKYSVLNAKDFNTYWQSLDLEDSKINLEPEALQSLMEIFQEIQELGISISDEKNRQIITKTINKFSNTEATSMNDLGEALIDELSSDELVILISKEYFKAILPSESFSEDTALFGLMRDGLFYELGLRFPKFKIIFDDELKQGLFKFKINDSLTHPFTGLGPDKYLVNDTVDRLTLLNIKGTPTVNPANGSECSIISSDYVEIAKQAGLTTWDGLGYLILCFSSVLRNHGKCFIHNKIVHDELEKLATAWPKLVEMLRSRYATGVISKILRLLISEEISIRNLRLITMSILDMDYITADPQKYIVLDDRLPLRHSIDKYVKETPEIIAEYIRSRMKEYISHKYTKGGNTLVAYLLDPAIEAILEVSAKDSVSVSKADYDSIMAAVSTEIENLPPTTQNPVILTYNTIRSSVKEMISQTFPRLAVVAYNELAPEMNIQPIARIMLQ